MGQPSTSVPCAVVRVEISSAVIASYLVRVRRLTVLVEGVADA